MSKLSVSQKRLAAVKLIAQLSSDAVKELFAALANQPAELYQANLAERVAPEVSLIPQADIAAIVDTLLSMYPPITFSNRGVESFISDLIASVEGEKGVAPDDVDSLKSNLDKLLRVPSLSLGAKATGLMFQTERTLITNRVITDIRPIFNLDNDDVGGAIIMHSLKLDIQSEDSDSAQSLYITVDSDDIDTLIINLERAKQKTERLKALLSSAGVTLIEGGDA